MSKEVRRHIFLWIIDESGKNSYRQEEEGTEWGVLQGGRTVSVAFAQAPHAKSFKWKASEWQASRKARNPNLERKGLQ